MSKAASKSQGKGKKGTVKHPEVIEIEEDEEDEEVEEGQRGDNDEDGDIDRKSVV